MGAFIINKLSFFSKETCGNEEINYFNLNQESGLISGEYYKEDNSDVLLENAVRSLESKEMVSYLTAAIRKRVNLAKSILNN